MPDSVDTVCRRLEQLPDPDLVTDWPAAQWEALVAAGGMQWNIAKCYGGDGTDAVRMLDIYRRLAASSLLTAFILTQRNAACSRIESSPNAALANELMPRLARGELLATVGISHLTTSRQHLTSPSVTAVSVDSGGNRGYRLTGTIPWVTAALRADLLVIGGTLADGRQLLAAIPVSRTGVMVQTPAPLMGLNSSQTSRVLLQDVIISAEEILHGPVDRVLSAGSASGTGSLVTSAVALGAAQGTLRGLASELVRRPELTEITCALEREALQIEHELLQREVVPNSELLRRKANSLVLRAAQSWLAATKGAGYLAGHPAGRAVRESMFFLVWSCPQVVLEGNLREFACSIQ